MPRNKNIGRTALGNVGLILQSKSEIDKTEYSLLEAKFLFHLRSGYYPSLDPPRGTPCPNFVAGDTLTQEIMSLASFLGAQTSKYVINGFKPGIDTLEVDCQGAIFGQGGLNNHGISSIAIATRGAGYGSPPTVALSGGGGLVAAQIVTYLEAATRQINSGGTGYQVGDVLTVSGGSFVAPAQLVVDTIGTGGSVKVADGGATHFSEHGTYSVIPGTTAVSLTGGHGTGATVDLTFDLASVVVTDGGSYSGTPSASLSGGSPTTAATLGAVTMGSGVGADDNITPPFTPTSTTKDTVQFVLYAGSGTADLQARLVATADLGAVTYYTATDGTIRLQSVGYAVFPGVDGVTPSVGDDILLTAESNAAYNGLYKLIQLGSVNYPSGGSPWVLTRVRAMDDASEISAQVYVNVSDGTTKHGTRWHCTTTSITNLGTDPIAFALVAAGTVSALYQVTIDYDAIDLHFEYMAKTEVQQPRFIQNEYVLDSDGLLIVDPATGKKRLLSIDNVYAQPAIIDPTTGSVSFSGAGKFIDESIWRPGVKYVGTSSRFEQTPAGQFFHVLETTTIKIAPILPSI